MAEPRKTRGQLNELIAGLRVGLDCNKATIADIEVRRKNAVEAADGYKRAAVSAEEEVKRVRAQFDDLKQRLVQAEADNQRMRGYIDRVQEDDVAREDLVAVGDPAGEQQLVPKRRPKHFSEPNAYLQVAHADSCSIGFTDHHARERPKPRHWVTY